MLPQHDATCLCNSVCRSAGRSRSRSRSFLSLLLQTSNRNSGAKHPVSFCKEKAALLQKSSRQNALVEHT